MPTFELKDFMKLDAWLKEGLEDGVRRGLVSAGFRLLGVIQNEVIPELKPQPVDSGAYRASWKVETTKDGAEVFSDMPYASVIEYGARAENVKPGRAMIDALAEWVRRKGLTGHAPGERSSADAHAMSRSIAWAIARSMQQKGIFNRDGKQGLRVAEKAAIKGREFVEEEFQNEVRRALK